MALDFIEKDTQVEEFLVKVRTILSSKDFDINKHLDIQISPIPDTAGYKNFVTLADLGYDSVDIKNELLSITLQDYSETMFDKREVTTPLFRVFSKYVNNKEVYIKIKLKGNADSQVFCISFHYAENKMSTPHGKRKR
jgi:hypothetical protein